MSIRAILNLATDRDVSVEFNTRDGSAIGTSSSLVLREWFFSSYIIQYVIVLQLVLTTRQYLQGLSHSLLE